MIHKSKKIADDGFRSIYVHMFIPESPVCGTAAFIVIENLVRNSYRQDISLMTLGTNGKFNSGECTQDVFREIEEELGYPPDVFLYIAEWHDCLSGCCAAGKSGILRDVVGFINSISDKSCAITLSVDDIVDEVMCYIGNTDVSVKIESLTSNVLTDEK